MVTRKAVLYSEFKRRYDLKGEKASIGVRPLLDYMRTQFSGFSWSHQTMATEIVLCRKRYRKENEREEEESTSLTTTAPAPAKKPPSSNPITARVRVCKAFKAVNSMLSNQNLTQEDRKVVAEKLAIKEGAIKKNKSKEDKVKDAVYVNLKAKVSGAKGTHQQSSILAVACGEHMKGLQSNLAQACNVSADTAKHGRKIRFDEDAARRKFAEKPKRKFKSTKYSKEIALDVYNFWVDNTRPSSCTKHVMRYQEDFDDGIAPIQKEHIIHWQEDLPKNYHTRYLDQLREGDQRVGLTYFRRHKPPFVKPVKHAFQCVCIYCKNFTDGMRALKKMRLAQHKDCSCLCDVCKKYCHPLPSAPPPEPALSLARGKPVHQYPKKPKPPAIVGMLLSRDTFEAYILCPKVDGKYQRKCCDRECMECGFQKFEICTREKSDSLIIPCAIYENVTYTYKDKVNGKYVVCRTNGNATPAAIGETGARPASVVGETQLDDPNDMLIQPYAVVPGCGFAVADVETADFSPMDVDQEGYVQWHYGK